MHSHFLAILIGVLCNMRSPLLGLKRSDLHRRGRERRWGLVGGCTSQAWKQPIRLWYDKCTLFEPFLKLQYIEQIQISNAHQQRTYPPICKLFFTKKNLVTAQWKISVVNMILLFTILWFPYLYISRVFQEKRKNTWFNSSTPPLPILYLFAIFKVWVSPIWWHVLLGKASKKNRFF